MAEELKTCANCGNTQATGAFCEACGTRLPEVVAASPAPPPPPPPPMQPQPVYAAQPEYAQAPPSPTYTNITGKGFWSRFFDFSFKEFITPSVIKVLFIVIMVVIGLTILGMIVTGFMMNAATGVLFLIGGLVYGFFTLLFSRVFLELVMVFFHIHDTTKDMAARK